MWSRLVEFLIMRVLARLFPGRYRLIPRRSDGAPLLRQFALFGGSKTRHGCYLQSFVNPEEPDLFHRHRWTRMISIVLSGSFSEERYPGNLGKTHSAPSIYTMDGTVIHRLNGVAPRTWTLFFMFNGLKAWGYYKRPIGIREIPWNEAIPSERRVKAL